MNVSEPTKRVSLPREFPGVHYYGEDEEAAALRVIRQRSPFRYYGANFLAEADSLEKEFAAGRFAREASARGLTCTHLPDYGLHVYCNVKALIEKRSNSADGFPWTHPANAALVRDYRRGALPKTDELLARSVVCPVPSNLTPSQENEYTAVFREAHGAAGIG